MTAIVNRVGHRAGKLLVISRAKTDRPQAYWTCRCDCGKICNVAGRRLNEGPDQTQSCGCLRKLRSEQQRHYGRNYQSQWRIKNPEKARAIQRRANLKRWFGLTEKEYSEMWLDQGGLCAICLLPLPEKEERGGFPPVDHCHKTNKNRGIVHGKCNKGLGLFDDDPIILRRAARYLEVHING